MKKFILLILLTSYLTLPRANNLYKWGDLNIENNTYSLFTESSKSYRNTSLTYTDFIPTITDISKIIIYDESGLVKNRSLAQDLVKTFERKLLIDYYLMNENNYLKNEWIFEQDIFSYFDNNSSQNFWLPTGSLGDADQDFIDYVVDHTINGSIINGSTTKGLDNYERRVSVYKDMIFTTIIPESGNFDDFANELDKGYGDIIDEVFKYTELNSGNLNVVDFKEVISTFYEGLDSEFEIILKRNPNTKTKIFANKVKQINTCLNKISDAITIGNVASDVYKNVVKVLLIKSLQESEAELRLETWLRAKNDYGSYMDSALKEAISQAEVEWSKYNSDSVFEIIVKDYLSDYNTYISSAFFVAEKLSNKIVTYTAAHISTSIAAFVGPALLIGQIGYETWKILNEGDRMFEAVVASATIERTLGNCIPLSISNINDYEYISVISNIRQLLAYFFYTNMYDRLDHLGWYGEWISSLEGTPREVYEEYENYLLTHKEIIVPQIQVFRPDFFPRNKSMYYSLFEKICTEDISPILSNGTATPQSGTTNDSYTFSVTYKDLAKNEPQEVKVHIGDYEFLLSKTSEPSSDEIIYSKKLNITTIGNYSFYFTAKDYQGNNIEPYYPPSGKNIVTIGSNTVPNKSLELQSMADSYFDNEDKYFIVKTLPAEENIIVSIQINDSDLATITMTDGGNTDKNGYAYGVLHFKKAGELILTINASGFNTLSKTINIQATGNDNYVTFDPDYFGKTNNTYKYDIEFRLDTKDNTYRNYIFSTSNGYWENGLTKDTIYEGRSPDHNLYITDHKVTDISIEFDDKKYCFKFYPQMNEDLQNLSTFKTVTIEQGSYGLDWRQIDLKRELFYVDRRYIKKLDHTYNVTQSSSRIDPFYAISISPNNQNFVAATNEKLHIFSCDDFSITNSKDYNDIDYFLLSYDSNGQNIIAISDDQKSGSIFSSSLSFKYNFGNYMDEVNDMIINPLNNDILLALDNDINEFQVYTKSGVSSKSISIENDEGDANSVSISPSGNTIVVSDNDNKNLKFYSSSYNPIFATTLFGETPEKCEWNPNPTLNYLAIICSSKVYILDMNQYGKIISVSNFNYTNSYQHDLKWSDDGKILSLTNSREISLFSPFDISAPVIQHNLLADTINTSEKNLSCIFNISDENEILSSTLEVNSQTYEYNTENIINKNIELNDGSNSIKLTTVDEFLNQSNLNLKINYTPQEVSANFFADITSGTTPLTIQFTDQSTGSPTSWLWDFGDGSEKSTTKNPEHTYTSNGQFNVTLTVSNETSSDTNTKNQFISVNLNPLQQDSLALVALYNATDGQNWNDNTNWLTGSLNSWVGITTENDRVTKIELIDNELTGILPSEMEYLTQLETLLIYDNNLTGNTSPIKNLINLEYIVGDNNQFSDDLSVFKNLTNLYWLSFENNNYSGDLLSLCGLTNLRGLFFNGNLLSGNIPQEIGQLNKLVYLYLHKNQLTGSIPTEIGQLTILVQLSLFSNQLEGSIPIEIGQLTSLEYLFTDDNQLSGSIPAELGNLSNLLELGLYKNNLSGEIPKELGNLINLKYLGLFKNNLSGKIPKELGNLSNLEIISIRNNNLSGSIPESFGNLPQLNILRIENNNYFHSDIEPILNWSNYNSIKDELIYAPQDTIGTTKSITTTEGSSIEFSIDNYISSSNDIYQWYKDGSAIEGANSLTFQLNNPLISDSGEYYCQVDNNITTELTLHSRPIDLEVSANDCPLHFQSIWEGTSGQDHMNIYVIDAQINGVDLANGDEVGIFDGDLCVGYGKVQQTIDQQNYLSIIVSSDDGTGNGYIQGNNISYKLWDCSESSEFTVQNKEYYDNYLNPTNTPVFEVGSTALVQLYANSTICQSINFSQGWNIFSSSYLPNSSNMLSDFDSFIESGSLVKIQDEDGNAVEYLGFLGWINDIGEISPTEGYKVKVNTSKTLDVCGTSVNYPYSIPLHPGWNIIGFPHTSTTNAKDVIQQLINKGSAVKIQDEKGNAIENLGFLGWINNIGSFIPGKGYKIKVNTTDTLWIQEAYPKSSIILPEIAATDHYHPVYTGNGVDHMNLNLVNFPNWLFQAGDEIAIYDGSLCVGVKTITEHHLTNQVVSITASASDNSGMPGFCEGNPYSLKLWKSDSRQEYELESNLLSGYSFFKKQESALLSLKDVTIDLTKELYHKENNVICYPNPFSEEIRVEIELVRDSDIKAEIINQLGQSVKFLSNKKSLNKGKHALIWNGRNNNNNQVSPGIYYLKISINNEIFHRKIIFTK